MEMANNSITHIGMPSTDFGKTKAFYEQVFGWKCEELVGMNYMLFTVEGGLGGGFNKVNEIISGTGHMAYITVEDILEMLERVKQAGGQMVMPKTALPNDWGFIAQFSDPCGLICGLWSSK